MRRDENAAATGDTKPHSKTLLALYKPQQYLRPGLSLATLQCIAGLMSDTEAARRMQQAKHRLFEQLRKAA
jgi:hypothetical protein